jgi:CPA2 family monovalent cation:H+ antiporter-2
VHGAPEFLRALTIVLGVAAVVTVVFQRLRQPVVLGYLLAGLIIGPHLAVPLVADPAVVRTLSDFGVILLMFSLGLEFSLRKLARVGSTAGVTAVVETSLMLWLGFTAGKMLGWTTIESLFAGAVVAISSTTIIAKAFDEQGVTGPRREFVVGILIVEDLIAILLLATLTAVSSGAGLSAGALAATTGRLTAFLAALVIVGMLVVPRAMRAVVRLGRPETTLIAAVAVCFAVSLVAEAVGYSVALGAFLAGSLVAESGEARTVAGLVAPVRDMFAAVFFVSVGMLIDPALAVRHWGAVLVLTGVVIAGKTLGVSLGAFLTGNGVRTAVQSGMSLAQIGEFSFILASLGLALGATRGFLYPVAVSVSALTALSTPWLIRASGATAAYVDRRLPRPLQTFAALYGTWIEGLRSAPPQRTWGAAARRLGRLLAGDMLILAAIAIGSAVSFDHVVEVLHRRLGMGVALLGWLVVLAAVVVAAPFVAGVVRVAGRLGGVLADAVLPGAAAGRLDAAAAPRRALVVTIQLTMVLLVGVPLVAVTQPFLPGPQGAGALALLLGALAVAFWRSAANLQGHVRAGAQVIAEVLRSQARAARPLNQTSLAQVQTLLPGIGAPEPLTIEATSPAVGRSLAELNLRGATGATVLEIHREDQDVLVPGAHDTLRAGDVLALAGTREALDAAARLLRGGPS